MRKSLGSIRLGTLMVLACSLGSYAQGISSKGSPASLQVSQRVQGPSLRADAGNHSFQGLNVAPGGTSHPFDFRIYNDGDASVARLVAEVHGDFVISKNSCSADLPPTRRQGGCVISVAFRPTSGGYKTGDLTLSADNIPTTILPLDAGTPIQFGTVQAQTVSTEWVQIPTSTALTGTVTGPFSIALQGPYQYDSIAGVKFGSSASGTPVSGLIYLGVRLEETTPGNVQGTVTLSDGTTYSVAATVAAANAPVLAPATIQFLYVPIGGSTANPAPFTLTNPSSSPLAISAIQTSAPFSSSSNCGTSLAAGASCTIDVTFTPTSTAEADGQLTVSAGSATLAATLQGFGQGNREHIAISPADTFLNYTHPGDVSPPATWTVKNLNSNQTLSISVYATLGGCSSTVTTNCAQVVNDNCATLAPMASCELTFRYVFGPPVGDAGGNTTLIVNGIGNGSDYAFSFNVIGPKNAGYQDLVAYPSPLTFPTTAIGQASGAQDVRLSNAASYPVEISAPSVNGFNLESNCSILAPGTSCDVSVRFTPVQGGSAATYIPVTAYPPGDTATGFASIGVQGFAPVPTSLASPAYPPADGLDVTPTPVADGTHVTFAMPVRNEGSEPLIISNVYLLGGDVPTGFYVDPRQCAAPVAPGGECVLTLTYDAEGCPADGIAGIPCFNADSVYIASNAVSSPDTYFVSAEHNPSSVSNPLQPGVMVGFGTPDFGSVPLGQSASSSVTFSGAVGPIPAVSIAGTGFELNNGCASLVGSRTGTCTVQVRFAPTSVGFAAGSIKLVTNLGLFTESLWGTGIAAATTVSLSATSEAFPSTIAGATSAAKVLTVTNTGSSALGFTSFALSGEADDFVLSNGCGSVLAAKASCSISISFKPVSAGSKTATLVITDRAVSSPQSVTLTGTATAAPIASVFPASETFPSTVVGSMSAPQDFTLLNTGSADLKISLVAITGEADDFVLSNNCGASLAPHATCTLSISFKPVSAGNKSATLVVTDDAAPSSQSATMTGIAIAQPSAALSATREAFPSTAVGSTSAAKILTVTNTAVGSYALILKSFKVIGEADDFVLTNNCINVDLAPSSSCTISIVFKPVSAGSKSATLVITDDAASSPQSVVLTGTATSAAALKYLGRH